MNAKIKYKVENIPHPYKPEQAREGIKAFCLIKVVEPEIGPAKEMVVAMFSLDSEAELFMGHLFSLGLTQTLIDIDPDMRETFEFRQRRKQRA